MATKIEKAREALSALTPLTHIVQCNQGVYWETIAAFNVGIAARAYAAGNRQAAREQGLNFRYRTRAI